MGWALGIARPVVGVRCPAVASRVQGSGRVSWWAGLGSCAAWLWHGGRRGLLPASRVLGRSQRLLHASPHHCTESWYVLLRPGCRNVKMYPGAQAPPGILVLRVDAPIYYANVEVSP